MECICHEDGTRHPDPFEGTCPLSLSVADGYCGDESNTERCNYDGGDCCNKEAIFLHCNECTCHPDAPQSPEQSDKDSIECLACESSSTTMVISLFCTSLVAILTIFWIKSSEDV